MHKYDIYLPYSFLYVRKSFILQLVLRINSCISSLKDACICLYYEVNNPHTVITASAAYYKIQRKESFEYRTIGTGGHQHCGKGCCVKTFCVMKNSVIIQFQYIYPFSRIRFQADIPSKVYQFLAPPLHSGVCAAKHKKFKTINKIP